MRNRLAVLAILIAVCRCAGAVEPVRLVVLAGSEPAANALPAAPPPIAGGAPPAAPSPAARLVALLEPKLGSVAGIRLLDRESLGAVLKEQELSACFSAEAITGRIKLGQLLHADLLVLLRPVRSPVPHLDLIVCETRLGCRLLADPLPVGSDIEADTDAALKKVQAAVERWRTPVRHIVTVPPLVCDDFSIAHARDGSAYARLIERLLLDRPGVTVVELAEARQIATEVTIAGGRAVDRPLPLYLTGTYRSSNAGSSRVVRIRLSLKEGDRVLATAERDAIAAGEVSAALRGLADTLLEGKGLPALAQSDPSADAARIYERGTLFLRLGQPDEALDLCEASLLLKELPRAHLDAAWAGLQIWDRERERLAPRSVRGARRGDAEFQARFTPLLQSTLPHVEAYMIASKLRRPDEAAVIRCLAMYRAEEASDLLLRVLQFKRRAGVDDGAFEFASDVRWASIADVNDRYARLTAVASQIVRSRGATPAMAAAYWTASGGEIGPLVEDSLARLATCDNPVARSAARELVARLAHGKNLRGERPADVAADVAAGTASGINPGHLSGPPPTPGTVSAERPFGDAIRVSPVEVGLSGISGCIPAGPDLDVLWATDWSQADANAIYLLGREGPAELLARTSGSGAPVFDGRWLWFPMQGKGGIEFRLVDVKTREQHAVTTGSGLPDEPIVAFTGAALAPGSICAAALVSRDGVRRNWIAVLSFDPVAGGRFVPVYEARMMGWPKVLPDDAQASFFPETAACLQLPEYRFLGSPLVVPGWNAHTRMVNIEAGNRMYEVIFPDGRIAAAGSPAAVTTRGQPSGVPLADTFSDSSSTKRWWIASAGSAGKYALYSRTPGGQVETNGDAPPGALAVTEAGAYLLRSGDRTLFVAQRPGSPFVPQPTAYPQGLWGGRATWFRSNRFGMLLVVGGHAYRFEDPHGGGLPWTKG